MDTSMEELNAKGDRAGRATGPDLAMQRGCVHCYLDHDGAGEMTIEGSTICSRRNWPMSSSFLLLAVQPTMSWTPGKECQLLSVVDSCEPPLPIRGTFSIFSVGKPGQNAPRGRLFLM